MNATQNDPMTHEPERVKVEDTATPEKLRALADDYQKGPSSMASDSLINDNWQDKPHRLVYSLCATIRWAADALSVSEKRVEEIVRQRDAAREALASLGYPFLPCPICKGIEGCDHTVPERATHRLTTAESERDSSQKRAEDAEALAARRLEGNALLLTWKLQAEAERDSSQASLS